MATLRQIKRRIRSITNTAKITKAMEMIAASKMRRAQQRVLAARPYAEKMYQVLADLAAQPRPEGMTSLHPLLEVRPVQRIGIVHITTDRGLCGGLNANVNRLTASFLLDAGKPASLTAVGRKGRDFVLRNNLELRAEFTQLSDKPTLADTLSISHAVMEDYEGGRVDEVYLAYPRFVTTMNQRPAMERLLPVKPALIEQRENVEYIYEPTSLVVLGQLLPRFVEMQVYRAFLEAIASEQSARMVAMRSATDNANDMIQELTLSYNKVRQEAITKELLDITGAAAALT
ncbi:MAG: ATP synthase F1 subunit gamma [Chloroflexi bacterium]|nr:ATP synthase F1 subunit gamma [Chloroflexota bacterium]